MQRGIKKESNHPTIERQTWILLICMCTFSFSLFLFLQGCRNLCNIISSYTHIILVCVTLTFLSWLKIFLNIMFSGRQDSSTTCATIDEMTCVIWHLSRQQCFIVINMMVMEVFMQKCDVSGYRFPEVELLDQRIEILFRFLIQKDQRLSRMWFHFVPGRLYKRVPTSFQRPCAESLLLKKHY